jgi:hypothetical protein
LSSTSTDATPREGHDEDHKQRVDRELIELLNELRVALPGVQVLFAFLLTIPFAQGFTKLDGTEKFVYAASLMLSAAATGLLIAPTSYHRLQYRAGDKEQILLTANKMAIVGLVALAGAIACAVYVVMAVVFDAGIAVALAGATAGMLGWLWYGLPLTRKLSS